MDVWHSANTACPCMAETSWPVACYDDTRGNFKAAAWDARNSLVGVAWIQHWLISLRFCRLRGLCQDLIYLP